MPWRAVPALLLSVALGGVTCSRIPLRQALGFAHSRAWFPLPNPARRPLQSCRSRAIPYTDQIRPRMNAAAEVNTDICELPGGTPFDISWLAQALGASAEAAAGWSYSIPAGDVVRGPHSVAARLLLHQSSSATAAGLPASVFVKRVVPAQLPPRAPTKWIRDAQSYRAEVGFYAHFLEPLRKQGVLLPTTYKVVAEGLDDLTKMLAQYESSSPDAVSAEEVAQVVQRCHFMCLVEDLNPAQYRQDMLLGKQEMERVLCAMARMHAATWEDFEILKDAQHQLFAQGSYWSPDKRDAAEVANLPKVAHVCVPACCMLHACVRDASEAASRNRYGRNGSPGSRARWATRCRLVRAYAHSVHA